MFAVNRFVVAPNDSTRGSGVACELAERPVGCCWQRRLLLAERETAALRTAESALTTAVIPEITGSHRLLLVEPAALAGTFLRCTRRSYTCLPQCYYRGAHAACLNAYFVVMLCFKFVYAVLCGILRYLSLVVSS